MPHPDRNVPVTIHLTPDEHDELVRSAHLHLRNPEDQATSLMLDGMGIPSHDTGRRALRGWSTPGDESEGEVL